MKTLFAIVPPLFIVFLGALLLSLTWVGALVIIFGALDTHGRWRDYKYLSTFEFLSERLALFYGRSFCGRWLVMVLEPRWYAVYKREGYRFYHFMPDNFPFFLIKFNFWRAMFAGHQRAR